MLWPLVLPLKITFWTLALLVALATAFAPLLKWKRGKTFLISTGMACVAFIPSCAIVNQIVDAGRFGVFHYDTFADVDDFRVERYLPPTATSITIQKHSNGFRARFTISPANLNTFLDNTWKQYGDISVVKRGELQAMKAVDAESHDRHFGDLGWTHLENAAEYDGPAEADGGGFTIWYDPSKEIAYQRAGYW